MTTSTENPPLYEALAELEAALETPIVPGELAAWVDMVRKQSALATPLLKRHIESVHNAQFDEISDEETDLLHCVTQLRAADKDLLNDFASFDLIVFDLPKKVLRAEPDEAPFMELAHGLSDQGLALVIRARKQELAITTWLVEAFNRDSGEV